MTGDLPCLNRKLKIGHTALDFFPLKDPQLPNEKVRKFFRFSYKIAKTANSETALTSDNTWIWRLKFGLRVHNELYSILFTNFFDFETHVSG